MNQLYKRFWLFLAVLTLTSSSGWAQCILFPGNLVFSGVSLDDDVVDGIGKNDRFSFVLLQDVSENFEIYFTDLGWTTSNSFQSTSKALTDGAIRWTAPAGGVEAGTQITITAKYSLSASLGTVSGVRATPNNSALYLDLGISGDQLFAFTGSLASPTFIAGVNLNQTWTSLLNDKLTSAESSLPSGLTIPNVQNLSLLSSFPNGFSNAVITGSSFSGLFSVIVASFNSNSNWSFDETYLPAAIPAGFQLPKSISFTVTPFNFLSAPSGTNTITYGSNTQFVVNKVDIRNIVTYRWEISTNGGSAFTPITEGGLYSGVATNTLVITKPLVSTSNYKYRVYAVDACGNETFSSSITLTVNPKTLTPSLVGTVQKERDGTTNATILNENLELAGIFSGDDVMLVNPGTGTYASALPGTNIQVTVSGLSLTGTDSPNYVLSSTSALANIGTIVDTTPPTGYSVVIDQDLINELNTSAVSFTLAEAEIGATVNYTFSSSGGGTPVTGSVTVTSSSQQVTGINLTDLGQGTITLNVTLTDPYSNTGLAETDTSIKFINSPPTVANPILNQNATEDAAFNFQFAGNVFQDPDVGDVMTYSAHLSGGGALPAWLSFDPLTRTFSGTPLNANVGIVSIDVIASDANGGSVTDTFDIVVANVNDAPTVANPLPDQSAAEDVAFNFQFASNSFNDIDVGDVLTYAAQLSSGEDLPTWLSFDSNNREFSGTPGNDDTGLLVIKVVATDLADASVSTNFELTIQGVNDAPEITAPLNIAVFEDQAQALTAISFSDLDAGSNVVTATFGVASGTLSATSGGGVTVGGTSSARTLSGAINDVNTFISAGNLTFTTALNSTADVTLNINISDNGNTGSGGPKTANASLTIEVTAVNDAPVNSVPGNQQTDQDVALVFSSGNGNLISVSDVDAGGATIRISLTATNGLITLSGTTGLSFNTGTGVNDTSMDFAGTITAINSALSGMTFNPIQGYSGSATLTIISDDQGFSGSGGIQTDTDIIDISVNSINPVVTSVTSSTANGLYKEGDELSIQVIFDQPVEVSTTGGQPTLILETGSVDRAALYVDGSGTTTLNFSYIVQEGDFSGDLDYASINSLILNGAVIENSSNDPAILELPAVGSANSISGQKNLIIDTASPLISSVSVPANGVYRIGQNLNFTVNFTEAVVVNGTPQLSLTIGASSRQASYVSGSGTSALVFRYSVQSGDLDLNGIVVGTFSLNSGTVRDAVGNDANLTLNNIGSTSQVLVDGVQPTVVSLSLNDNSLAIGQTATLTVVFSERISGLEISDFTVDNGNLSGLSSSDGGETWTASFTPSSGVEDDTNVISLDNSGYNDLAGNAGSGTTESFNYEIDTQRPTALVNVADGQLTSGETSLVTITFSEPVTGLGLDDFTVSNGSLSNLVSLGDGAVWQATLTPDSNVEAPNNIITLDNTGYQDLAGNTGTGVSNSNNYSIDTQLPSGYSVSILADRINGVNQNNFRFNLLGGEVGSDYSFSISSSGGGVPVTGTGEVTSSNQLIDGINVSSLPDGILTLTVTLTDASGNEGAPVTDTVEKLLPATLTIRVVQDAVEGGDNGQVVIETDNTLAAITVLELEIGGTATPGEDYTPIPIGILFPGNTNSVLIPVTVIDDLDVEGEETVSIRIVTTDNSLVTLGDPGQATLRIGDNDVPRQLTITPDTNQQKVYGDEDPTTFSYTASGFDPGDDVTILQGSLSRQAGEDAGTYSYTLGNLDAGPNYELVVNAEVFTITPATLSIEVGELGKVYGDANPDYTYVATGLKLTDTQAILTGALGRAGGENVGTYGFNLGTLSAGANYTLQLISNTPFQITPAPLRLIAENKEKIFGAANPPLTFRYDGLVNGDTQIQTLPTLITTATETSPVGTYPITLSGGSDPNYSISRINGILTVERKTVTITAVDQSKVYGQDNPVLTFSYSGLLEGDTQIQSEPTISTEATISSPAGSYEITLSGGSDPNYDFTLVNGNLSVIPANLTITADDKSKMYGEANPALTYTYNGLVNGDTQVTTSPSISTTATQGSNVGTYPITLSGGSDPNYTITLVNGTLSVTPADLTITAEDKSKVYGEVNPALTFSYAGLVNGDTGIAVEPSLATPATASSPAGSYPITVTGGSDPNYAITLVNGTLTIGQKTVTITAADQSKVYGQANPTLTFSYNGLLEGDTQIQSEPTISTEATVNSPVGTYEITLSGGSDPNYAFTLVNGTLSVTPASLTITADDKSKVYGEANPALTFSYAGFVNGDTQIAVEPSITTTATASSNVGTYPITLTGGEDDNYAITLVNGTLTIGQKALTITADDKQKVYGEANPPLTFTYNGLVNGDTQVTTEPSIATPATASSNVGTYPITLSGGSDQNYAITLVNGTLTIGQKALTITADDKQKIYGEANPPLTFSYSGLVNGDTQVTTEPSISTTATQGSNVGTYPIILSGGSDQNYAITLVNGTLTVNQAILKITADAKSKIFGNPDPALTFTATGFKLSDTEAILTGGLTRVQGETVGIYAISQGTLDAGGNYQIEFVGNEFEIIPAELAEFLTGNPITTPWSVDPALPNQIDVLTQDGQILSYEVAWDKSTLDLFRRGTYMVFGTVNLPAGVLNPSGQKAVLQVIVLPKPAPTDIILSNNSFIPDPNVFFQEIGFFTVLDEFDDIHTVELVPGAAENAYFEINSDILFWSSAEEAAGVTEFTVLVRVTDRDGNVIEKSFIITRDRKDIEAIEVFNTFSPNNDGINDTWGIPDLKYFAGGRVQVFDRSGQRVFYTESPAIRWDGTFEGKEMPVGSYIWILESRETGELRRGILTLLRK